MECSAFKLFVVIERYTWTLKEISEILNHAIDYVQGFDVFLFCCFCLK